MKNALFAAALAALALASCRTPPPVFVTPETDEAIAATASDVDAISSAAATLSDAVGELKAGAMLTETQIKTLTETTKTIVKQAEKARKDVKTVQTSHAQDNVAASEIAVSLVEETKKTADLRKTVAILSGVIILALVFVFLKILLFR